MESWNARPGKDGCVWDKRSDPGKFQILITRKDGTWIAVCVRIHDNQLQRTMFESHLSDATGIEQCLAYVRKALSGAKEPEFDIVEAKTLLGSP